MPENLNANNQKAQGKSDGGDNAPSAFKPSISIQRKQTRRINVQIDEGYAVSFDEYVRFVSECCGYDVVPGEVMNEILKAHFARDGGFKQWRSVSQKNEAAPAD